jgi:hypothetical protein
MNIDEILTDFKRRYEHSYIWVAPPESDEESLFFVSRITKDKCSIANLELTSPEFGKIILNMGTSHTLKFKYPPVGVFQSGTDAYMFRRLPVKQYRIGIYDGNSSIAPVHRYLTGQRATEIDFNFDQVLSAFRKETHTFRDALKMLASGKYRSVALSRNFSLMLSYTGNDGYLLLYWETPIALIDTTGTVKLMYEKSYESVVEQIKGA